MRFACRGETNAKRTDAELVPPRGGGDRQRRRAGGPHAARAGPGAEWCSGTGPIRGCGPRRLRPRPRRLRFAPAAPRRSGRGSSGCDTVSLNARGHAGGDGRGDSTMTRPRCSDRRRARAAELRHALGEALDTLSEDRALRGCSSVWSMVNATEAGRYGHPGGTVRSTCTMPRSAQAGARCLCRREREGAMSTRRDRDEHAGEDEARLGALLARLRRANAPLRMGGCLHGARPRACAGRARPPRRGAFLWQLLTRWPAPLVPRRRRSRRRDHARRERRALDRDRSRGGPICRPRSAGDPLSAVVSDPVLALLAADANGEASSEVAPEVTP